jgi:hypothetical protein
VERVARDDSAAHRHLAASERSLGRASAAVGRSSGDKRGSVGGELGGLNAAEVELLTETLPVSKMTRVPHIRRR